MSKGAAIAHAPGDSPHLPDLIPPAKVAFSNYLKFSLVPPAKVVSKKSPKFPLVPPVKIAFYIFMFRIIVDECRNVIYDIGTEILFLQ